MISRARGSRMEEKACRYLTDRGLRHICSNYRCKAGEIDLVMEDGYTLVFVEVRYRSSIRFGGALTSVTPAKQRRLRRTADHYLQQRDPYGDRPCRFDVVACDGDSSDELLWIRNAI